MTISEAQLSRHTIAAAMATIPNRIAQGPFIDKSSDTLHTYLNQLPHYVYGTVELRGDMDVKRISDVIHDLSQMHEKVIKTASQIFQSAKNQQEQYAVPINIIFKNGDQEWPKALKTDLEELKFVQRGIGTTHDVTDVLRCCRSLLYTIEKEMGLNDELKELHTNLTKTFEICSKRKKEQDGFNLTFTEHLNKRSEWEENMFFFKELIGFDNFQLGVLNPLAELREELELLAQDLINLCNKHSILELKVDQEGTYISNKKVSNNPLHRLVIVENVQEPYPSEEQQPVEADEQATRLNDLLEGNSHGYDSMIANEIWRQIHSESSEFRSLEALDLALPPIRKMNVQHPLIDLPALLGPYAKYLIEIRKDQLQTNNPYTTYIEKKSLDHIHSLFDDINKLPTLNIKIGKIHEISADLMSSPWMQGVDERGCRFIAFKFPGQQYATTLYQLSRDSARWIIFHGSGFKNIDEDFNAVEIINKKGNPLQPAFDQLKTIIEIYKQQYVIGPGFLVQVDRIFCKMFSTIGKWAFGKKED